mmetsp:Transcript_19119/g.43986  ORF Transcript_19119/g.43986 Transcript_19119/m.43986 type:complete len:91 (+) Transcript_19119:102-374(+)
MYALHKVLFLAIMSVTLYFNEVESFAVQTMLYNNTEVGAIIDPTGIHDPLPQPDVDIDIVTIPIVCNYCCDPACCAAYGYCNPYCGANHC